MGTSTEQRERARELAHESYGRIGLYPDDYEAVVDVYAEQLEKHHGDDARATVAACQKIDSRMAELAEDDPYWAEFLGWQTSNPAA